MKYRTLTLLFACLLAWNPGAIAQTADEPGNAGSGAIHQTAFEAHTADVALLAAETGLAVDEVRRAVEFQAAFATYAEELLARFPDQISGIWTDEVPKVGGYVRFLGRAPREVAPPNVVFLEGGRLSLAEHRQRAEVAAAALAERGYRNFLTYFDPIRQVIQVEMKAPADAPVPGRAAVLDAVRERVWNDLALGGEALVVRPADLDLSVLRGTGPIYTLEHSRGGNWVLDDGFRKCTSGWSVNGSSGDGIITAAHCTGLNQFEEPGVAPYSMSFIRQHRGSGGDAEYHTTAHVELAEFYATATTIRDVTSVRATNTMVGNSVCVYGRSSNSRSCAHVVEAVGVTVTFSDGVTVSNLARASGDTTIGGDSGGGWSFNNAAWGVHSGSNGSQSFFTPAQQAQSILSVTILTK